MKTYVKLIALLCACVMLLSVFASCAAPTDGEESTEGAAVTDPESNGEFEITKDPNYDDQGYLLSKLPEDLKFEGETVSILHWNSERAEFEILEDQTGLDLVKDAIYERNAATEKRLGITFEWTMQKGDSGTMGDFVDYVRNSYAGGNSYDIIATYSRTAASLSANGLLEDLNKVEENYIDFEMPWWPEAMLSTCAMKDSLFFISGDISTNLLHMM